MAKNFPMPKWATQRKDGVFEVDPDLAYPAFLKAYGVNDADVDQYWLEVCFQSVKLYLQMMLHGTSKDSQKTGIPLQIRIRNSQQWRYELFPAGKGVWAATKGYEAKEHFARVFGAIPPAV